MRLAFYIALPERNLQRIGSAYARGLGTPVDRGTVVGRNGTLEGRSLRGYKDRELNRFFPVILLLEGLAQVNQWQLRRSPGLPPLYQSGVFYKEEAPGCEDWLDIPHLYAQGFGDCEDIACARTAELREQGVAAVPCIKFKDFMAPVGGVTQLVTLIHVMVLLPDGTTEDPSKVLGMKGDYQ